MQVTTHPLIQLPATTAQVDVQPAPVVPHAQHALPTTIRLEVLALNAPAHAQLAPPV